MVSTDPQIQQPKARQPISLHVREWPADKSDSPTALLIHGMGGDSYNWEHVAPYLQNNGYHVLAPDLAGHGESPRRKHYSPLLWANDVRHVFDGQRPPELIIAHSLGGLIAAAVALQLPNKPQMVLVDPLMLLPRGPLLTITKRALLHMRTFTPASLHRSKPTWSGWQINAELRAISRWDPHAVDGLDPDQTDRITRRFQHLGLPVTIVRPVLSLLVPAPLVPGVQRHGIQIVNVPKAGHNLHRDDNAGFLAHLTQILATSFDPLPTLDANSDTLMS